MKKIILSILFFSITMCKVWSQTDSIPNLNFERWTSHGTYNEPDKWGTLNILKVYGVPDVVTKTTDSQSGSSAIRLETKTYAGANGLDTIVGWAFTGSFGLTSGPHFGTPYNERPIALKGYYKFYSPVGDACLINILLTKQDTTTGTQQTIGTGTFTGKIENAYTLFTIPITYYDSENPDSVSIMIVSSAQSGANGEGGIPGSVLYVDNLSLVKSSTGIAQTDLKQNFSAFPNPTNGSIQFNLSSSTQKLIVYDLLGNIILAYDSLCGLKTLICNMSSYSSGLYLYELSDTQGKLLSRNKFQFIK